MAIIQEHYGETPEGVELIRTYSDQNKYIQKVGTTEQYQEAIDVVPLRWEYFETDIEIEPEPEPPEAPEEVEEGQ